MEFELNKIRQLRQQLCSKDHRITTARFVSSPNYDPRPAGVEIDTLVVHAISLPPGSYDGHHIQALFTNKLDPKEHPYFQAIHELRVSAHALIRRDGSIIQFVPFDQRAWHAGQSEFQGRSACNDFSIGIELEGCDQDLFASDQYVSLVALTLTLFDSYPKLDWSGVVGHADIAPGRKTDPGPNFDWKLYARLVKEFNL